NGDRRAFLDKVTRGRGEFVEILLVERRGKACHGRGSRTGITAVLLAELAVDSASAVLENLGKAANGLGGLALAPARSIARFCRSLVRQRRCFAFQRGGLLRRFGFDRFARRGELVA